MQQTRTLLPLDRFAQIIGFNPIHFNGVQVEGITNSLCDEPLMQYPWQQTDRLNREEIAQGIADAEDMLARHLGFFVAPRWVVEESHNPRGIFFKTKYGYFISGGIEAKSLIDDAVAITYTDTDADNYKEKAVVTITTTVDDLNEIAVYAPGKSGDDVYEIRPILVAISGGTATITMRRDQLVKPELQEGATDTEAVDGTDDANFLTTVDVYRRYNNPAEQVQLIWNDTSCRFCTGSGCTVCLGETEDGCLMCINERVGMVRYSPGTWDADTNAFTPVHCTRHVAHRVRASYYSGWRDKRLPRYNVQMAREMEMAVVRLSISLFDRDLCGCETMEAQVQYWRTELNASMPGSTTFQIGQKVLDNPLGTSRGAQFAWNVVQKYAIGEGVS